MIAHESATTFRTCSASSEKVSQKQHQLGEKQANQLSVMLELQADYFAGVWAHHTQLKKHFLEEGDIESGLNAAYRHRRRRASEGDAGPRRTRFVHARHLGAACQVVPEGAAIGDVNGGDTLNAGADL